jgi:hypothetical protein
MTVFDFPKQVFQSIISRFSKQALIRVMAIKEKLLRLILFTRP